MVSRTFHNCIKRSSVLRRIFFLDASRVEEDEADSKPYLSLSNIFCTYGSHEECVDLIYGNEYRPFSFLTLADIRRFVPAYSYYIDPAVVTGAFISSRRDRPPILKPGSQTRAWEAPTTQVRPYATHPFIVRNLCITNDFFWSGFGHHAVIFVENPFSSKIFRAIENLLLQVQRSPTASWIEPPLSNPAFTTVSLVMHGKVSNPSTSIYFVNRCEIFRRETGALLDDLLIVLAKHSVERFEAAGGSNALYVFHKISPRLKISRDYWADRRILIESILSQVCVSTSSLTVNVGLSHLLSFTLLARAQAWQSIQTIVAHLDYLPLRIQSARLIN